MKNSSYSMAATEHTKSFKYLLIYALPYALIYTFLPLALEQTNFILGGFLLSAFVVIILALVVPCIFKTKETKWLEKAECSRIGIMASFFKVVVSSMVAYTAFYTIIPTDVDLNVFAEKPFIWFLLFNLVVMFLVHYVAICYSLWYGQKILVKLNKNTS